MQISVIIPTFNRVSVLARALESVLNQSGFTVGSSMEVIVIDDGSTDGTLDLLANNYHYIKVLSQPNLGVSAARNAGLAVAKGEWIALLDSDDEWLPHKLHAQFAVLSETGLKVCHTEEIWIRDGVRVNQMTKHQKRGGDVFERCLPLCAMSPSSIVLHRSIFAHIGEFDTALPACEDYDLWLRLAAHYQVAYVEQACIKKYGGHDDQLSRAFWGMDRFRVQALSKLLRENRNDLIISETQRMHTLVMLRKKNSILLNGAKKHGNTELLQQCLSRVTEFDL